jgi:hypothetical protein
MAGNPKTSKSSAPSWAQMKPGSKGVKVGMNAGKGVVKSTAITSKAGSVGKRKK